MSNRIKLKGTGIVPDVAIGKAVILEDKTKIVIPYYNILKNHIDEEVERFLKALDKTKKQIEDAKDNLNSDLKSDHLSIFDTHLLILKDQSLVQKTINLIKERFINAEYAFKEVIKELIGKFKGMDDEYFKQRREDLEDIATRVIANLIDKEVNKKIDFREDTILVSKVIHPSDLSILYNDKVVGIATDYGGVTTHTSIIAKALNIPTVVGLHNATKVIVDGDIVIVDGIEGEVIVKPQESEKSVYLEKHQKRLQLEKQFIEIAKKPSITLDGEEIRLLANVELAEELPLLKKFKAEGVGLYRSEFIFLQSAPNLPSEEEHYNFYKKLCAQVKGEVIIRTLDLGGEKFFHEVLEKDEQNPVLGLRAVRFCLKRKDIFRTQLRGILRLSGENEKVKIMFPLISGVDELKEVISFLEEVMDEMKKEGVKINENIQKGIMIEVPSAAEIPDLLAKYVDFFSIGTNDLIQYTLAIDRNNDKVNYLYQPSHPAVIRMLNKVMEAAKKSGIDVSMCGEMAGNPKFTTLLLGMGLRKFSMTPPSLPVIKSVLRNVKISDCEQLLKRVLSMESASQIEKHIIAVNHKLIPDYDKLTKIKL
ncbi:ptsI phosphotransferase system, enzyme I, PtsI [Thermotomaculum hydrothermale]|uniref:Phosphoenolpyruvate-protein phosphotransferase n=1 Tax=Thermotomaculum hydrothermale TaxID=981385 RepID=A0A7R6SZ01_9BACT|nr:phosphoenolpyruvate--protein phosphotransferase [Thermotomaculum hydrothermale]BBB32310.1 ptsI phosphotransferase system, enzyme I, PtsI [Thermotomaculum hydrothermale]